MLPSSPPRPLSLMKNNQEPGCIANLVPFQPPHNGPTKLLTSRHLPITILRILNQILAWLQRSLVIPMPLARLMHYVTPLAKVLPIVLLTPLIVLPKLPLQARVADSKLDQQSLTTMHSPVWQLKRPLASGMPLVLSSRPRHLLPILAWLAPPREVIQVQSSITKVSRPNTHG